MKCKFRIWKYSETTLMIFIVELCWTNWPDEVIDVDPGVVSGPITRSVIHSKFRTFICKTKAKLRLIEAWRKWAHVICRNCYARSLCKLTNIKKKKGITVASMMFLNWSSEQRTATIAYLFLVYGGLKKLTIWDEFKVESRKSHHSYDVIVPY